MRTNSQIVNQCLMLESEFQVGVKVRNQILMSVWAQVLFAISPQLRETVHENK
jgi:hypothetical protein